MRVVKHLCDWPGCGEDAVHQWRVVNEDRVGQGDLCIEHSRPLEKLMEIFDVESRVSEEHDSPDDALSLEELMQIAEQAAKNKKEEG